MLKAVEKVFKALADKNRLRILKMLQRKSMCVCEIREVLGLAQPTVSKHLKILKDAGIIEADQKGLWTNYSINCQNNYALALSSLAKGWLGKDAIIQVDLYKARNVDRAKLCCPGKRRRK